MQKQEFDLINKKTLVEIRDLSVHFKTMDGRVQALDHVNLDLKEGEILGIIGESGSGKSTTALAMLGLLADNAEIEGRIEYLDKEIINSKDYPKEKKMRKKYKRDLDQRLAEIRWKEISMIFQGAMNAFNPVHTIRSQIEEVFDIHGTFADISEFTDDDLIDENNLRADAYELALQEKEKTENLNFDELREKTYNDLLQNLKSRIPRMSDSEKRKLLRKNRIEESCRLAGFNKKFLDSYPHELSGGMKQRGIIAMALALKPKVVIADEPTTGLDVITQAKIIKELKNLKDNGTIKSMIVISHDVGVVSQLANFVAVMYAGRIMEYGKPEDIFLKSKNPYTYALMHSYPSIEQTKKRIRGIPGSVPDLIDPPKGCYFANRCFMAESICFDKKPEPKMFDENHYSLCHFDQVNEEIYNSSIAQEENIAWSNNAEINETLVEANHLTKFFTVHSTLTTNLFGGANKPVVHAVDDVNLKIPRKTIIGVVGESGSGKTTLGRLLVDAIEPTKGNIKFSIVKVNGENIQVDLSKTSKYGSEYRTYRKEAQLIFQDPFDSINPKMSIFDIVAEPLVIQAKEIQERRGKNAVGNMKEENDSAVVSLKDKKFDVKKEIYNALSTANLRPPENYAERFPHELSGGERQRVSIARAITLNPSFLVADEPISMLDVSIRANIMNLLIDLKNEKGISVLYISHDIASARYVSDYIVVMYLGQILEFGRSEELIKNPLHPYTKALISAVPSIDPNWVNKNLSIVGEIGSAINPKKGCRFYGRCVFRKDVCKEEDPEMIEVDGRYYLCHFTQEELTPNYTMKEAENLEEGDLREENQDD
ncbi:ABC transporter ATP-binding protein [Cuniculiplasma sp. SKW4]|uniref:ABC transporter ATP-binding protein n=1 Tax=Cuniculiplasma sp. SKW4 TaxID=3400171 RepID=UPI003FD26D19